MDQDRQRRIRGLVAGALAIAYGRHGTTPREHDVVIDADSSGKVTVHRPTIGHETIRTQIDGRRRVAAAVDSEEEDKLARTLHRFADLHMALGARERCLEGTDGWPSTVPPWSVVGDALMVQVARRSGWDMAELCRLTLVDGCGVLDDNGFELGAPDQFAVRAEGDTYMATIMKGWLNGGVVGHPFKIRCGADGATSYDGKRRPSLTIMDQSLPETLLAACIGRRLDEVISHPVMVGSDTVISRAANVEGAVPKVEMGLRRMRVPLATAPAGVDTSWLDTIAKLSS